jgi:hypothetical protein
MRVACSTLGEKRNACRFTVRKPERKKPLEDSRHRLEDNNKIDLEEI